jgi:hypothetical protein
LKESASGAETGLEKKANRADDVTIGIPCMSGLYQRALEIYRQTVGLHLVPKGEGDASRTAAGTAIEEVSPEEREKILARIDELVARSRISLKPETLEVSAARSGAALPLLVNGLTVLVVVAAIFLSSVFLNRQEADLASGAGEILSAESKVVEAVRQESQAQLQQKDQEILSFQQKLSDMARQREQLAAEMASSIRLREQQLQDELAQALEAERRRLVEQGLSGEAVQRRLAEIESQRTAELEGRLQEFRREAETEAAAREATLNGLVAEYRQGLQAAQAERGRLEQELSDREAQLRAQYQTQAQSLESDRARAAAELTRLQEQQGQEQLVLDRLLTSYEGVSRQLAAGDYAGALQGLSSLRAYLEQGSARVLPTVQKRRPVELFIIASLEELARSRAAPAAAEGAEPGAASAEALAKAQAETQAAQHEAQAAQAQAEAAQAQARAARAETQAAQREAQEARQAQASALAEAAAARQALRARLATLQQQYERQRSTFTQSSLPSPELLSTLLQAKLLVLQIIGTEPVAAQHPDLYRDLERYFDTLAEQRLLEGRYAAVTDMVALLDAALAAKAGDTSQLQPLWQRYSYGDREDLLSLLFGRLSALLAR